MIAVDLECSRGHIFEGWFDNLEAFDEQNKKKLVACPYCDDTSINRVLSPVAFKRNTKNRDIKSDGYIDYQRLAREVVHYIQENFEDVGPRFTTEALKIHYGVSERRNIRGSATHEEEETLKEEGVEFFKVPTLKIDDNENKN